MHFLAVVLGLSLDITLNFHVQDIPTKLLVQLKNQSIIFYFANQSD